MIDNAKWRDKLTQKTDSAWKKKEVKELRQYIGYATREINKRIKNGAYDELYDDYVSDIKAIAGTTKTDRISYATAGKETGELVYQARLLNQFLEWDITSSEGTFTLTNKTRDAFNAYNKNGNTKLNEEEFKMFVELMGAFTDKKTKFSSEQIAEEIKSYDKDLITKGDVVKAMAKASKLKGATKKTRTDAFHYELDKIAESKRKRARKG